VRARKGAKPAPEVTGNGLRHEHSGKPLDRSLITNSKRRQADRGDLTAANKKTKRISAARRDEPVTCAACGRKVQRRMRGQRYCSARCRENDRGRVRKAFLVQDRAGQNMARHVAGANAGRPSHHMVNLTRAKDAAQSLALAVLNQFKKPTTTKTEQGREQ
jgi:hypothetical protein